MPPPDAARARRTLPNGKPISSLGFGCSSLWSKPHFPAEQAAAMLAAACAEGINHFDTGPSYAEGEARLGAFLAAHGSAGLVISTKVGTEYATHARSFDPARMQASFAGSLARLGLDCVDILYLHGPARGDLTPAVFDFLARQKAAGRIAYAGVNTFDAQVLAALIDAPIDVVMLQYSIDDRRCAGLIDRLHAAGKVIVAGTIMGQGVFDWTTFVPRNRQSLWYLLRALKNDPLFAWRGWRLARRLQSTGLAPHAAAIGFVMAHPQITSGLFGTSRLSHLVANARAAQTQLTPAQLARLL